MKCFCLSSFFISPSSSSVSSSLCGVLAWQHRRSAVRSPVPDGCRVFESPRSGFLQLLQFSSVVVGEVGSSLEGCGFNSRCIVGQMLPTPVAVLACLISSLFLVMEQLDHHWWTGDLSRASDLLLQSYLWLQSVRRLCASVLFDSLVHSPSPRPPLLVHYSCGSAASDVLFHSYCSVMTHSVSRFLKRFPPAVGASLLRCLCLRFIFIYFYLKVPQFEVTQTYTQITTTHTHTHLSAAGEREEEENKGTKAVVKWRRSMGFWSK